MPTYVLRGITQIGRFSWINMTHRRFTSPFVPLYLKESCFNESILSFGRKTHSSIPGEGKCGTNFDGPQVLGRPACSVNVIKTLDIVFNTTYK